MAGKQQNDPAGLLNAIRAVEQTTRSLAKTARRLSPPSAEESVGRWHQPQPNRTELTRDNGQLAQLLLE